MFTKGGEFQSSIQVGNGLEAQAAFSASEHFGLMANYAYGKRAGADPDNEDDYHRHSFFEGGLGYFDNSGPMFFEVFAGYGRGEATSVNEFFSSQSAVAKGEYERYFLQPAFGVNNKVVDFSFVSRFSMVDFYIFSNEMVSMTVNEEPKFFFEPGLVGRGNFADNRMFVIFQAGLSIGISENIYFDHRTFQVSTGLGLRLGGKKALIQRLD
jgi:hypothetical protein